MEHGKLIINGFETIRLCSCIPQCNESIVCNNDNDALYILFNVPINVPDGWFCIETNPSDLSLKNPCLSFKILVKGSRIVKYQFLESKCKKLCPPNVSRIIRYHPLVQYLFKLNNLGFSHMKSVDTMDIPLDLGSSTSSNGGVSYDEILDNLL